MSWSGESEMRLLTNVEHGGGGESGDKDMTE